MVDQLILSWYCLGSAVDQLILSWYCPGTTFDQLILSWYCLRSAVDRLILSWYCQGSALDQLSLSWYCCWSEVQLRMLIRLRPAVLLLLHLAAAQVKSINQFQIYVPDQSCYSITHQNAVTQLSNSCCSSAAVAAGCRSADWPQLFWLRECHALRYTYNFIQCCGFSRIRNFCLDLDPEFFFRIQLKIKSR